MKIKKNQKKSFFNLVLDFRYREFIEITGRADDPPWTEDKEKGLIVYESEVMDDEEDKAYFTIDEKNFTLQIRTDKRGVIYEFDVNKLEKTEVPAAIKRLGLLEKNFPETKESFQAYLKDLTEKAEESLANYNEFTKQYELGKEFYDDIYEGKPMNFDELETF